jgi:ketosteroid isomerase-like protein
MPCQVSRIASADVTSPDDVKPLTVAVIDDFLSRTVEGVPERIAALYAEEVDWRVSWPVDDHPAVPWIRRRRTRDDVADHYRTFAGCCDPAEAEVTLSQRLILGQEAILFGASSQLVRSTGRRFAMTFALHLTVENGLIVRHHMYEDSLAVVAAFETGG